MYCSRCGKQNQDEAKFCFNCGNTISSNSSITSISNDFEIKTNNTDILYAGFWKRLFAFILDIGVLSLLGFLLGIILSSSDKNPQKATEVSNTIPAFSFFITWLYFSLMESSKKQATLGKLAMGIKVVDIEGNRITFMRATGRYFSRIISSIILFFGYLMIAFTEKKQALHDKMANCLIVNRFVTNEQIKQNGLATSLSRTAFVGLICLGLAVPISGILAAITIPAWQDYKARAAQSKKQPQPSPSSSLEQLDVINKLSVAFDNMETMVNGGYVVYLYAKVKNNSDKHIQHIIADCTGYDTNKNITFIEEKIPFTSNDFFALAPGKNGTLWNSPSYKKYPSSTYSIVCQISNVAIIDDSKIRTETKVGEENNKQISKPEPLKQDDILNTPKSIELSEQQYHEESQKFLNDKNWNQLEVNCLNWINRYPNSSNIANAWNLLGIAYSNNSKYDESINAYQKTLGFLPNDKVILANLEKGKIYKENELLAQQAKKYFDNKEWFALENYCLSWTNKYQDNPFAWNYLGLAYYNNNKLEKSLKAYKKALEYVPGNQSVMENMELANNAIQKKTGSIASDKNRNNSSSTLSSKPCIYKQTMNNEEMRACGITPPTTEKCVKTKNGEVCLIDNLPSKQDTVPTQKPVILCPTGCGW